MEKTWKLQDARGFSGVSIRICLQGFRFLSSHLRKWEMRARGSVSFSCEVGFRGLKGLEFRIQGLVCGSRLRGQVPYSVA